MAICSVLLILTMLFSPSIADAYSFNLLDCDQLVMGSWLVVLARPIRWTSDTGEGPINHDFAESPEVWVETTFRIDRVLKGSVSDNLLVLHHMREPEPGPSQNGRVPVIPNGPPLFSFDPPARQREMVLFLAREASGRYAPFPDQQLAGAESIYPVDVPIANLDALAACELNPDRRSAPRISPNQVRNPYSH